MREKAERGRRRPGRPARVASAREEDGSAEEAGGAAGDGGGDGVEAREIEKGEGGGADEVDADLRAGGRSRLTGAAGQCR